MRRYIVPIAVLASILSIVFSGWLGYFSANSSFSAPLALPSLQQATPTAQARTVTVTREDVRQVVTVAGNVIAAYSVNLSFSAAGRLTEVDVLAGDEAAKGQVLAIMDPAPLKLALIEAQVAFQVKQDALKTLKASSDPESTDVRQAEADALSAKYDLDAAQTALTNATMLAPFGGRVLTVNAKTGDSVSADSTVIELADLAQLQIQATVGQEDVASVQAGQTASVTFDAFAGQTFTGKVVRVVPTRTSSSGAVTYTLYVSLDKVPTGLLPGMTSDADVIVAERKNALTLPRRSIRAAANATVTVSVLKGGQTESRSVKVGLVGDLAVEILSGLDEGDQVVTTQ